jgi:hypothetical protein
MAVKVINKKVNIDSNFILNIFFDFCQVLKLQLYFCAVIPTMLLKKSLLKIQAITVIIYMAMLLLAVVLMTEGPISPE